MSDTFGIKDLDEMHNLFEVELLLWSLSQGSEFLATLGFGAKPRWV